MQSPQVLRFGAFELEPVTRQLSIRGARVKLGSRAFDLLRFLATHADRVVTKEELLEAIWGTAAVEEANIAVHVNVLRKLLGATAIATVPRRGYQFALRVQTSIALSSPAVDLSAAGAPPWSNLPLSRGDLHGRSGQLARLLHLLGRHDLVTLWGPGGMGKTRLAQAAAVLVGDRYPGGVWWVDLAPISDGAWVTAAVARAMGLQTGPDRTDLDAVIAGLRERPALLVLDNAEHVVAAVVTLVAALRQRVERLHLLVTSQQVLKVEAEAAYRLGPLDLPNGEDIESVRMSPAVTLFVERAQLADPDFALEAFNHAAISEVCRRLDGIPLAIELAASQVTFLGLEGVRSRLNDQLQMLVHRGHNTAPRHRTLRAALDWSHSLLGADLQVVLRRLAIFVDGFTLEAARFVAQDAAIDGPAVVDHLRSLVDRSLVVRDEAPTPRYHLLELPRLYASERLEAAGELAQLRQRHARALVDLLTVRREDSRRWHTTPGTPAALAAEVSNCRAAMEWVQTQPDDELAIEVAGRCSYAFLAASLNAEYVARVLPLAERAHAGVSAPVAALFWARIALSCSRNAHPFGFRAAQRAVELYREIGDDGRLYDALTWAVAIGARLGLHVPLDPLVQEAERIERADWPLRTLASFQWAKHRWLLMQGRNEEAMGCALAQAELLRQDGHWATHVALGANVADCEITLGRVEAAQQRSAQALDALSSLGIRDNLVGHVLDARMVALVLLGRRKAAIEEGKRARVFLEREGDELRLLEPLALNQALADRAEAAALALGHAESTLQRRGEIRWPAAQTRRQRLEASLSQAISAERLTLLKRVGASLSREQAFSHVFAD